MGDDGLRRVSALKRRTALATCARVVSLLRAGVRAQRVRVLCCAQGDAASVPLVRPPLPHPPSPLLPPTRRADVHVPLGTLLPSWFHFCATRARSDAQDSQNCTADSSHTLLVLASYGERQLRKKAETSRAVPRMSEFVGPPEVCLRSICQTQRCTCPQRRVEQECLKKEKVRKEREGEGRGDNVDTVQVKNVQVTAQGARHHNGWHGTLPCYMWHCDALRAFWASASSSA